MSLRDIRCVPALGQWNKRMSGRDIPTIAQQPEVRIAGANPISVCPKGFALSVVLAWVIGRDQIPDVHHPVPRCEPAAFYSVLS
jgi:hypothetical protein